MHFWKATLIHTYTGQNRTVFRQSLLEVKDGGYHGWLAKVKPNLVDLRPGLTASVL